MSSNRYKYQKVHKEELRKIWQNPQLVNIIHYSCESFYDRSNGNSPRITSIAIRNLASAQTKSFSIHKFGEIKKIDKNDLTNHYDDLEKEMLKSYFYYVKLKDGNLWLHWNMRSENYGFYALEMRAKVLGLSDSDICIISDDKKHDLARIIAGIYGPKYIDAPRMSNLCEKNSLRTRDFKLGEQEAELFISEDYLSLHQSTLAKVGAFSDIAELAHTNKLKTNTGWLEYNAPSFVALIDYLREHPIFIVLSLMLNLFLTVIAISGYLANG